MNLHLYLAEPFAAVIEMQCWSQGKARALRRYGRTARQDALPLRRQMPNMASSELAASHFITTPAVRRSPCCHHHNFRPSWLASDIMNQLNIAESGLQNEPSMIHFTVWVQKLWRCEVWHVNRMNAPPQSYQIKNFWQICTYWATLLVCCLSILQYFASFLAFCSIYKASFLAWR